MQGGAKNEADPEGGEERDVNEFVIWLVKRQELAWARENWLQYQASEC